MSPTLSKLKAKGSVAKTGRQALHAVADPEPARRREFLEQDGAGDQRNQRRDREGDADGMVDAAGDPAFDHEGNAADAEQKACRLAPCHPLVEEQRGHHGRQHRIGADDERRQAGRDAADADIAEAEIGRLVGDPEHGEDARHRAG